MRLHGFSRFYTASCLRRPVRRLILFVSALVKCSQDCKVGSRLRLVPISPVMQMERHGYLMMTGVFPPTPNSRKNMRVPLCRRRKS